MKAYVNCTGAERDELWIQKELQDPICGPNEVVIKIRSTSLNYRDLRIAKSRVATPDAAEQIPLSDGAGEIVAIGSGVSRWSIGDRVAGSFFSRWIYGTFRCEYHEAALGGSASGMLAEYVALPADGVVRIPQHLSFEEAATLPCAALTAWNALMETGPRLAPGATVLTLGTGGVSMFALQFAKAAGLEVFATTSSDTKASQLQSLGVKKVINYRTDPEWDKEIVAATTGVGVDHVVEVGGAGTLARSISAVRFGGHISLIGILTGVEGQVNPQPLLYKNVGVQGIYVGSVRMFASMNTAIETLRIRPIIDRVFDYSEALPALKYLETGQHLGKIVIRVA